MSDIPGFEKNTEKFEKLIQNTSFMHKIISNDYSIYEW